MARVRKTRLTDVGVARLKPAASEFTVWDMRVPGLGVRVRPSGHRGYVYQCKVDGRAKRVTLGCQSAFNIDPQSACKIDPPEWHGGGCPGSQ